MPHLTKQNILKANINGTLLSWNQNEYCITFDPTTADETELQGKPLHLICTDGIGVQADEWCETYESYLYPAIISCISIIFLIITVLVYIIDDSLRF